MSNAKGTKATQQDKAATKPKAAGRKRLNVEAEGMKAGVQDSGNGGGCTGGPIIVIGGGSGDAGGFG